jgi:uncharacterized protein (DUF2336 family)
MGVDAKIGALTAIEPVADQVSDAEAARVRKAAWPTTPASMLQALAEDPAVTVRAAVALNPVLAPAANARLVSDSDERVRMLLAGKLVRLLPGLSGDDQAAAQTHVHQTLLTLAGDAAVRVRVAISDALNTMPEAPRDVIMKLAYDPVLAVSNPIVRFSPLLTDADLLELLALPPHPGMAEAVASRPGLSSRVADDIALHAGSAAVRALLENPSAVIQETTLDSLVGRAGEHPEWHEPLVRRPSLSTRAVQALSRLVAAQLLDMLVNRADLPAALAEDLRGRLAETLAEPAPQSEAEVLNTVRALNRAGRITEQALLDVAASGDHRQVAAILAVGSGVALGALDRAVALRSAKALVSLVWRAGFSMRAGTAVQLLLGRLSPDEMLLAGAMGEFPLSPSEMEWQIELLGEPGR